MVMVDLYAGDGRLIAQTAGNFLNIFDDTFTEFVMETPYIPAQDETIRVHLYNAVPWDGPLGLWASGNEVAGMPLYAGTAGENPLGATLAVQRVSDYSGSWPSALVRQLALPLTGGGLPDGAAGGAARAAGAAGGGGRFGAGLRVYPRDPGAGGSR